MISIALIGIASLSLLAALAWLFNRLVATRKVFQVDADWWRAFRADRYAPVLRLLSQRELDYVATLPGTSRRFRAEFRRRRVNMMRAYLKEMAADFDRLQAIGQLMVTAGEAGRELREALFRERIRFTAGLWSIRLQMAGFRFGLSSVDASVLVGSIDELSAAVRARQGYAAA